MRSARGSSRARARITIAAIGAAVSLGLGGVASAAVLDRAVQVWVGGVERALAMVGSVVPPPRPAALVGDDSTRVRASPGPRRRALRPRVVELLPDERLDAVRAAFCPEAARRLCDARRRCGCVYAEPDCLERVEQACSSQLFSEFEQSADRLELAPDVLDRCLDGFAELPTHCELAAALVHGCMWPVRDVATLGQECVGTSARCRDGACVSSHCAPLPRTGESAAAGVCALSDVEVDRVCRTAVGPGGACEDYLQCSDGRGECGRRGCVGRIARGGECDSTWACVTGLACHEGHCREVPTWCDQDTDCGSEQECVRPPSRCEPCGEDEACVGTVRCVDGHRCAAGLDCAEPGDEGRCQPMVCRTASLEALFRDLRAGA